ncbi:hypothetical protein MATR_20360 [Marivirga tractuosa]|uniref:S8 family peptidase n=1 Tax=Marivirga tractuosa TaxID=1006 RepID=UPI002B2BB3BA|nr:hypothetical protein MATR_20360 [Marivirga tractuosa]
MLIKNNQNLISSALKNVVNTNVNRCIFAFYLYLLLCNVSKTTAQSRFVDSLSAIIVQKVESVNSLKQGDFYLIQFERSLSNSNKALHDHAIVKRLKNDADIIHFDSLSDFATKIQSQIRSIYQINNDWKKSLNITNTKNDYLSGDYWLRITNENDWQIFEKSQSGISAILQFDNFVKVRLRNVQLKLLLNKSFITYIEKAAKARDSEARVLDLNLNPNRINTIQAYYPELNGSSETVSIKEPFYNIDDIDISGRYITSDRESDFSDSHALEMTTIIAGNGSSFLTGLGVAPSVFHSSSSNETIVPDPISYFARNNIQTQNHSYGTLIESFYGVAASLYDQQIYSNPEIIHVFSVGNSGLHISDHGQYEGLNGFSNITGNFKQAKNILTIGAVDTSFNTIELNSNGPAFDGRIKPELVAYSMTGTSNSAALVSGVSILLKQAYRNAYEENLKSSLLKALLINSADEIGSVGPEHKTGYGSLNAQGALEQLEKELFIQGELIGDNDTGIKIKVPENAVNFKATLVWTDPPAQANDEYALVNDLNLQIKDGSGEVKLPWVLSAAPNPSDLNSAAIKGIDHINNIEQIHIERVGTDSIEFIVSSENTLTSPQTFAIAYSWEIEDQFAWTSPTFNDNIPYNGETVSHIRWKSSFSSQITAKLYYKLVSEDQWGLIEDNILVADEHFRWDPKIVNDFAQLKMIIGDKSYLSDTFSISSPLRLNVGFNCSDSLSFNWQSVENVDYYSLFNFAGDEIKNLINTKDTAITVSKSDLETSYLKVQAFKRGKPLITGEIIDYRLQSSNCFLESYFVESIQGEGIYHNLNLSSLSGVEKVRIEKRSSSDEEWENLKEFSASSFNIEFLETDPDNGLNTSRAIVLFTNGEEVVSEIQSTYYVKSSDFILYPNPIEKEVDLKVFAKNALPEAFISFYNLQGQLILTTAIPNDRNFIDLEILSAGMYFYKIVENTTIVSSGKILVQF